MKLVNPWPADRRVTSGYGPRRHPISGKPGVMHRGVDVSGRYSVTSAGEGIVHSKGYNAKGGGHWVKIDHGSGVYSVYYHGAQATKLNKGDRVEAGTFIYTSGSTGASTGDHLHFEIRTRAKSPTAPAWGSDVDPMPYLQGGAGPGSQPTRPTGKLDRDTIRRWQELLQRAGHNPGIIDGRMGPRTIKAIQSSVGVRPDGVIGPVTRAAVQKRVGVRETGEWDRETIGAIQRHLNGGKW
jgi:hypothetical protein